MDGQPKNKTPPATFPALSNNKILYSTLTTYSAIGKAKSNNPENPSLHQCENKMDQCEEQEDRKKTKGQHPERLVI